MNVDIPKKLAFLFEPARFKVAYGGRAGVKSWNFARALLAMARKPDAFYWDRPRLRIACARETMKSIDDMLEIVNEDASLGAILNLVIPSHQLAAFHNRISNEVSSDIVEQVMTMTDEGAKQGLKRLTEAIGRIFNGLEIAPDADETDIPERIAWATALVASLANTCSITIGVAEAAGLSAPDGEGLLSELWTALSQSRVTF